MRGGGLPPPIIHGVRVSRCTDAGSCQAARPFDRTCRALPAAAHFDARAEGGEGLAHGTHVEAQLRFTHLGTGRVVDVEHSDTATTHEAGATSAWLPAWCFTGGGGRRSSPRRRACGTIREADGGGAEECGQRHHARRTVGAAGRGRGHAWVAGRRIRQCASSAGPAVRPVPASGARIEPAVAGRAADREALVTAPLQAQTPVAVLEERPLLALEGELALERQPPILLHLLAMLRHVHHAPREGIGAGLETVLVALAPVDGPLFRRRHAGREPEGAGADDDQPRPACGPGSG